MAEENRTNSKKLKTQQDAAQIDLWTDCLQVQRTNIAFNIPPLLLLLPLHVLARLSWYTFLQFNHWLASRVSPIDYLPAGLARYQTRLHHLSHLIHSSN